MPPVGDPPDLAQADADAHAGSTIDARVARVYAFLAAAIAASHEPEPTALAAELARVIGVQALAVLHHDGSELTPVMTFGFGSDPTTEIGADLLSQALADGLPVLTEGPAPHRSRLVVPARLAGRPWGVVAVSSGLPDALGPEVVALVTDLAGGIAVVVGPLVPVPRPRVARERSVRRGLEAVTALIGELSPDADVASAAEVLVEGLAAELGWDRVLLVVEKPGLGVLPLAIAGDVLASAVTWPGRLGPAHAATPIVDGSRSHLRTHLPTRAATTPTALVVESVDRDAFDDLDEHVLRVVAPVLGAVLDGLSTTSSRRRVEQDQTRSHDRQRRRFTSLAHELRTPVTVMLGYADLLASPGPDSEQRQAYADTLARHARSLGRMVDNALVAWQIDDHSLELSLGPVDLHESALVAISALEADIPLDGVDHVLGVADEFWLPRVLQALLENARRFVPDAHVQLTTRVVGDQVLLAVHDDGPGIASDELAHIFDAFHRGHEGSTTPHRGVGLGLTVARALVREMGGELEAASAAGYGTTFTITLPRA